MRVTASAPGKTILMGEHAAVYGRPALVAAVDRRLYAEVDAAGGEEVRLELPAVGVAETTSWSAILDHARAARRRWREYEKQPGPAAFRLLRGDDPAHLVKVALGEAAERLGGGETPGVRLRLGSEIPVGAGFGSSAPAAVALVVALARFRGGSLTETDLERLSLEIERRQHGLPSGIDTATVIHGGLVWALRDSAGGVSVTPVAARSPALGHFRVFNSGTPAESTGQGVAAVRARRDLNPRRFEELLDRMETATREVRRQLEGSGADPGRLVEPLRDVEACLEEAGVVPPRLCAIARRVESRGGAAKISGAGALSGRGAGSLLVYHPEPEEIDGWSFLDELEWLDVRLGAAGVRVES